MPDFKDKYKDILYAPDEEYIKDHCFLYHDKLWHMYSISGNSGEEMSTTPGNEEKFSHSVSSDLCSWKFIGHCLSSRNIEGADMIWAPYVVEYNKSFYMFFTKCVQPYRDPVNWKKGARREIGLAVSKDLYNWKSEHLPGKIDGKDPHLLLDTQSGKWLLYVMDGEFIGMTCWQSDDLINWHNPVQAFHAAPETLSYRNIYESPFVLYYPNWKKYILFLNLGYSISDNPFTFKAFREYSYKLPDAPTEWLQNQKYFHPQIGFAGEIIQTGNEYYRSSCYGPRNAWKIKFFKLKFLPDAAIQLS